jgi:ABC-2 type transport system permease protein
MTTGAGAVYDRGYQPYDGEPGTRRTACLALYRASLRRALGLRRSWKQKALPAILVAIATLPAFLMVGIGFITRGNASSDFEFISYRDQVGLSSVLILYVALTAPDLTCPDRRNRVMSLLLARPLTSIDYALVKVATVVTCVLGFSLVPQVVLFLGQTAVNARPRHYVAENAEILWQAPLSCLVLAVFYGVVGIAFASLTSRRVIATASLLGTALITGVVAGGLAESAGGGHGHPAALLSLVDAPLHISDIVFLGEVGPEKILAGADHEVLLAVVTYLGMVLVALGVLLWNYRPSRAGTQS